MPALVAGMTSRPEPERIPVDVSVVDADAERPPLLTVMARELVNVAVPLSAPPFKMMVPPPASSPAPA